MKKIGIVTICDFNNYGNRLQNYAMYYSLCKLNTNVKTIYNLHKNYEKSYIRKVKSFLKKISFFKRHNRYKNFLKFNRYIDFDKKRNPSTGILKRKEEKFDYFVAGSDQIWNPTIGRMSDTELLKNVDSAKRISYAASFGISKLPNEYLGKAKNELKKFKAISVREERGKEIVEELTGRKDIEVLVDPTMLLTAEEWDKVSKRPRMLKSNKYILTYFLGALSDERKKIINKVAKENNCDVINLLDKNDPFFECGPSEFLFLEKNAFLICTDSFHSSVFAILYNTPFLVYDREDNNVSMNSRIDTLLSKFKLEERKYKGKITKNDLKCNYIEAFKILEQERKKAFEFLEKALDIKDSD